MFVCKFICIKIFKILLLFVNIKIKIKKKAPKFFIKYANKKFKKCNKVVKNILQNTK